MQLKTLVEEFLFECEIREYSEKTVENYRKQLRHFMEFLQEHHAVTTLEAIEPSHIKAFIKFYQMRQCKPSYVNDMHCPFSGIYRRMDIINCIVEIFEGDLLRLMRLSINAARHCIVNCA